MKRYIDIICPVSNVKADEYVARTAAFLTVALTVTALLLGNYFILFLLAGDFAIRSFSNGNYSPVKIISGQITGILDIRNKKLIDSAPKRFAALLGMTFSFLSGMFLLMQLPVIAVIVASMLIFCAFLEGVFGYCLGCVVYTIITASSGKTN